MKVGDMIETAMVGRDGIANATAALDGKVSLHKAIVQVAGQASAMAPDSLRGLTDEFPPFRSILILHEQVVLAQLNSRRAATRATASKLACVGGFCDYVT
jgi:hypothetical protein